MTNSIQEDAGNFNYSKLEKKEFAINDRKTMWNTPYMTKF